MTKKTSGQNGAPKKKAATKKKPTPARSRKLKAVERPGSRSNQKKSARELADAAAAKAGTPKPEERGDGIPLDEQSKAILSKLLADANEKKAIADEAMNAVGGYVGQVGKLMDLDPKEHVLQTETMCFVPMSEEEKLRAQQQRGA